MDMQVNVELIDENDEIPQFIGLDENGRYPGSIAENLDPGTEVIVVTATDKDEFPAFKKVFPICCMKFFHFRVSSSFLSSISVLTMRLLLDSSRPLCFW